MNGAFIGWVIAVGLFLVLVYRVYSSNYFFHNLIVNIINWLKEKLKQPVEIVTQTDEF